MEQCIQSWSFLVKTYAAASREYQTSKLLYDASFVQAKMTRHGFVDSNSLHVAHLSKGVSLAHNVSFSFQKSLSYHREDVYDVFPGSFATLEMKPDSMGTWMLHCHVNDHMTAGMIALFEVGSAPRKLLRFPDD